MALGAADTSAGIHFEGVRATGWLGAMLERLSDKNAIEPLSTPPGFTGALRPYQEKGFAWLEFLRRWELGACLADDMGLGKTIQTLALIERERNHGEDRPRAARVPDVGARELGARGGALHAEPAHRDPPRAAAQEGLRVRRRRAGPRAQCSRAMRLVHRDLEDLRSMRWAGVILDEAQNIKNPDTKQSMAVRAVMARLPRCAHRHAGREPRRRPLVDHGLPEPGLPRLRRSEFRRDFLVPIQAHRDPDAVEKLAHITKPFILRRLEDRPRDHLRPARQARDEGVLHADAASRARSTSRSSTRRERKLEDAEGIERRGVILATLVKLKQVCNHPAHFLGDGSSLPKRSGKLTRLTGCSRR